MSTNDTQNQDAAPRLRLKKTVDFSKADPNCDNCHGLGIARTEERDLPGEGRVAVPVVCRCVTRNGGVKKDVFDQMLDKVAQEVHSGAWARGFADDILRLPRDVCASALKGIEAHAADESKAVEVREALLEAITLIKQGIAAQPQRED